MRLMQKQESFFDLFDKQAKTVVQGARALNELMNDYKDIEDKAFKLKAIEHDGDEIAHEIIRKLNMTFVTPLDREDIHSLAQEMDDILDYMEGAADRMVLYEIAEPTESAIKLAKILLESAELVANAVTHLRDLKQLSAIRETCIAVNRLENQGDQVNRAAMAKLFQMHDQPIEALKWREVYYNVETAIDRCEDVADVLESITLKNA